MFYNIYSFTCYKYIDLEVEGPYCEETLKQLADEETYRKKMLPEDNRCWTLVHADLSDNIGLENMPWAWIKNPWPWNK